MISVIGVRFKDVGKVYYFDPNGEQLKVGDNVIVETSRGIECGKVALANRELTDDKVTSPIKKMIRKATKEDMDVVEDERSFRTE